MNTVFSVAMGFSMKIPYDIFIGGPMGNKGLDAAGMPFSDHLPNLLTVLTRISRELEAADPSLSIRLHTPMLEDESGTITSRIFGMIDGAELGIMDISAGSPSVMYELAMLHALGTPTIPVMLRAPDGSAKLPFYLKDTYAAYVADYSESSLYEVLRDKVRTAITGGGGGADPAMNPMTGFYGISLVDVSATTGLATGYFDNFIQHVIRDVGGVFTALDYEVEKFVILRPANLSETADLKNRVTSRLQKLGIEVKRVTKDGKTVYEEEAQVRKEMLIFRAGRFLFDIPAPLKVQLSSPRYKRMKKEADLNARGPFRAETEARLEKHEQQLLDKFFATLRYLARNGQNVNPNLMDFMTLDEFVAAVGGR